MLESNVLFTIPDQIKSMNLMSKIEIVKEASALAAADLKEDVQLLQKTLDDFRRDANAIYATKKDIQLVRAGRSIPSIDTAASSRPKMEVPDVFSGKREDWKLFTSHLDLYFLANPDYFSEDSKKIVFAVSRLGNTAAFKFMQPYIGGLHKDPALRPALITN
jgi:hypothetical protein